MSRPVRHPNLRKSSDSDFSLSRSLRPRIDFITILNGVLHEQQLLIIVVNVMLHAQLNFFFVNGSTKLV